MNTPYYKLAPISEAPHGTPLVLNRYGTRMYAEQEGITHYLALCSSPGAVWVKLATEETLPPKQLKEVLVKWLDSDHNGDAVPGWKSEVISPDEVEEHCQGVYEYWWLNETGTLAPLAEPVEALRHIARNVSVVARCAGDKMLKQTNASIPAEMGYHLLEELAVYVQTWVDSTLKETPRTEPVEGMRPLRRLDTMTTEEAEKLCVLLCDSNRHLDEDSRVTIEDIQVDDMIYNDGGNLVDEDVAVAIEFSCRCFEGKAAVFYNGDIELYDDQDDRHHIENIALIVKYLIGCGFGLYDDESASSTPSAREAELEREVEQVRSEYEEVLEDHRQLVRELDVLINGEAGAAKQASLCDIVGQVRREGSPHLKSVLSILDKAQAEGFLQGAEYHEIVRIFKHNL